MKSYYKKNNEVINYIIVGILTTIVSLLTYYICVSTFLNPNDTFELFLANLLSWIFAVIFSYITNRIYVFKSKYKKIMKELLMFCYSRLITLFLDVALMFLLVNLFSLNDKLSKFIVAILITVSNYFLSKFLVFTKQKTK